MSCFKKGNALLCAGVLFSGVSWAEEEIDEIEEIVVTAAPLNRPADELTQPALIVDKNQLLTKATASIGETLANEVGISATYFGPVAGRPIIRGQDGPRISVLDSGISTLDVADLSPDHAVPIEPLFADQIEVIRGPATLLYGSSAAGGVVNVVDNRIPGMNTEEGVSGAIELRGDTAAEERTAAGRIDGRVDGFAWHVDGFTRENEDIEIADFATEDAADRPEEEERGELLNSFGESDGFSGGVSLIGERGYIGVSVSTYNSDYGLPGPEEEGEEEEEEEGPPIADGPFIELEQTRFDLRGEYQFDGAIESVEFLFARNDYEHSEIEPSGEVATVFDNEAWEARIELNHAPIGEWRGTVGLQINNREFSAVGEEAFIAPTDTDSVGIFIYEQRQFDDVLIDFGARVDFLEHDQSQDLEDYDETAFSLAVGARWEFAPGYDFNVNLSRSERHPDAAELYSEGAHLATALAEVGLLATLEEDGIVIAGPGSADTEVSNNLDIAIHHHSETLSWKFGVFFNDISDYTFREATDIFDGAELVLIDGLPPAPYQQVDAEFYGYEAELNWTPGGESSPWGVRVFSDMVRAEDDDSDDLPRIPPNRLGTAVSYQTSRWTANLSAIYHAEQDDTSTFETDSFTMLDANFIVRVGESEGFAWDIFVKGTNLLDEDARRATSFRAAFVPLPGASFHLGVRGNFN